jgi:hypothetical protein
MAFFIDHPDFSLLPAPFDANPNSESKSNRQDAGRDRRAENHGVRPFE